MTDWTELPNGAVAAGGLPSGETVTALRDNVPAMAEGAPGSPLIHGLFNLVEVQEPTSDVTTITFATDVTGMRGALVEFIGQVGVGGGFSASLFLDIRASGGTWRRVFLSAGASNGAAFMQRIELTNLNNADGSGIVFCWSAERVGVALDRSSNDEAGTGGGYSARSETIAEIRIGVDTGEIEGSNSNERAIAKLYVMPEPAREQSL